MLIKVNEQHTALNEKNPKFFYLLVKLKVILYWGRDLLVKSFKKIFIVIRINVG